MNTLSSAKTVAIADHARDLRASRTITGSDFVLMDAILCLTVERAPDNLVTNLAELGKAAGLARSTVSKGIANLISCGLLERVGSTYRVRLPQNGL
jgi:predicted transcriptional regulator